MSDYEFTLSLRIRHPSIEPSVLTQKLGIEPLHTWRAGDPRLGPAGELLEGTYRGSYWMGPLTHEPALSSDQVTAESVLLQALAQLRRSSDFLAGLSAAGGVAEVYVSMFAREDFRLELSSESIALLGKLGLAVTFDVHPSLAPAASTSLGN